MSFTTPCTACEGSGKSRSLQLNFFSDDCEACDGSGAGHPLWGRERFIQSVLEEGNRYIEYAPAYAEPGYALGVDQKGILFANWNNETRYDEVTKKSIVVSDFMSRFAEVVSKAGYETEWSDEWSTCSSCYKAFRTQADSHGWQPSYAFVCDTLLCVACIKEDPSDYIDERSGSLRGVSISFADEELEALGWAKVNTDSEFESGWHSGQADDPEKIGKKMQAGSFAEFLLVLDGVGQFDISFSVWVKVERILEAQEFLATGEVSLRTLARSARARRKQKRSKKSFER